MSEESRRETGRRRRRNWTRARLWHRWVGAVFALPLVWLAVSGVVLNHAEGLGMNRKVVRSEWLLGRYGMLPEGDARGVTVGTRRVAEWGGLLFLDEALLGEEGTLVGAVGAGADLVIGTEEALFVYGPQGELADVLDEASLPAVPVERIGTDADGAPVVEAGGKVWRAGGGYLEFTEVPAAAVRWSPVERSDPGGLREALAEGAGIPWSRVVLDLHSGNLLGKAGRFVVDLTGIAVVVLTLLGVKLLFKKMR